MPFKDTNRRKEYMKLYRQAHIEDMKEYKKTYNKAHNKEIKDYHKVYYQTYKDKLNEKNKDYYKAHKKKCYVYKKEFIKSDLNSLGKTKHSIRTRSQYYLRKSGIKIPDYQIHHCFTYDDPSKFIYCSKETHLKIHQFLRDNNIDADSNHYEQIKHLLDDTVVVFGV